MPGITPVFGLPYPLASDPVDPTAFADLAAAIDAAMVSVANERDAVLNKPMVSVSRFTNPVLNPGVDQLIGWDLIGYDTSGMAPAVGGTDITCRVPGVYVFDLTDWQATGMATFQDVLVGIFVNGVRITSSKKPQTTLNSASSTTPTNVQMVWPLAAGDIVTVHWQWSGTGQATSLFGNMAGTLICPLV